MAEQLPGRCRLLLTHQHGVLARWQAPGVGLNVQAIESLVRAARWRPLFRGVFATFTGDPPRQALLWAAVLRAGPHAVLSHETAAELDGLLDTPVEPIHVTAPGGHEVRRERGITVHRSSRIDQTRHPSLTPPRTMIEETVLDLTQAAANFDDAYAWASRACQRGLTTPVLLQMRMSLRKKMRWRAELGGALSALWDGAHSTLEFRYLRDVERAHRLPHAARQARAESRGRTIYRDVLYREYRVVVELDGRLSHSAEERWRDVRRDNAAASEGLVTLRYGWAEVVRRPCEVAAEVAAVLRERGWPGWPTACRPGCPLS